MDAILRSVQAELFRFIASHVSREDLAEDILQEVMIQIVRDIRFLKQPAHFKAWCYRIAARTSWRLMDRERRHIAVDVETVHVEQTNDDFEDASVSELLLSHVAELPVATHQAVWLQYVEEYSQPVIADILDIPVGTVKSRIAYGLAFLRTSQTSLAGERQ